MIENQKGQVLLLIIIVTAITLFSTLFLISGAQLYFQNSLYNLDVEKATSLAEAGVDKAIASLNKVGSYSGEDINLDEGTFSTSVTDEDLNTVVSTKIIESTGFVPSKDKPRVAKTVKISVVKGINVSFPYGIQTLLGGFLTGDSNELKGGIYSNSNITFGQAVLETGNVWVAGSNILEGNTSRVSGNVHSNTILHLTIQGDAYYKTLDQSSVSGSSYPLSPDPEPKGLPISDANIDLWKTDAEKAGIISDKISCTTSLGPGKIQDDLKLKSCGVEIKPPLWITGNLSLDESVLSLPPDLGSSSGVIIVDGKVDIKSNNKLRGNGSNGSFLVVVSTEVSKDVDNPAIKITGSNNIDGILFSLGTIDISGDNNFDGVYGFGLKTGDGFRLNYDPALKSIQFGSQSDVYSLIKGTYQVR